MEERLTMTSDKGGVAFTFDLDITCRPSEAQKILKLAEKLKHYEDLEEQGRLVILPDGMNLRKLLDILTEYSPGCPSDYKLANRCELSCFECWLAALKGEENATKENHILKAKKSWLCRNESLLRAFIQARF